MEKSGKEGETQTYTTSESSRTRTAGSRSRRLCIQPLPANKIYLQRDLSTETLLQNESWLREQKDNAEKEQQHHDEQEKLYVERERIAQEKWRETQRKIQKAREERHSQNAKIQADWQREQDRIKAAEEAERLKIQQQQEWHETLQKRIQDFVDGSGDMPDELEQTKETNPGKQTCPFFQKTAACRFGDSCSRNHVKPCASRTIVVRNFYSHYSLQSNENEHGDCSLEFDASEVYQHFLLFYQEVVPEMETMGTIRQFKVCCNKGFHLRGNVYVEYATLRQAMKCVQRFSGRYFDGKQMNVEFCAVDSWKAAICGLFSRKRCARGSACNFLHVFRNPDNRFATADRDLHRSPLERDEAADNCEDESGEHSERRHWRWSESPERIPASSSNDVNKENEVKRRKESRKTRTSHSSSSSHRKRRKRSRSREKSVKSYSKMGRSKRST